MKCEGCVGDEIRGVDRFRFNPYLATK